MSIITIQALVWSYAESILIIESQTAWLILSHKGYLEVNLTWNSYNKLKILSGKRKRTSEIRFFFKKNIALFATNDFDHFCFSPPLPATKVRDISNNTTIFFFILFKIFLFSFKTFEPIYAYHIPATFHLI